VLNATVVFGGEKSATEVIADKADQATSDIPTGVMSAKMRAKISEHWTAEREVRSRNQC